MSDPNEPIIDRQTGAADSLEVADVEITQQVKIGKFKIPTDALRAYTMMFALVVIWLFFQWATIDQYHPYGLFLGATNFSKLLQQMAVTGVRTWLFDDLGTKLAMLRAGVGWGHMPLHLVADDLASGRLARLVMPTWPGGRQRYTVIHRIDAPPGPLGRWIIDQFVAWQEPGLVGPLHG